ncbi:hypothetical protein F4818DRAFT_405165 [Hypoxylon cercidicola]|nr:hypothetical protein F4818DRAFT_405165 [Hypoxylon cercidicola]
MTMSCSTLCRLLTSWLILAPVLPCWSAAQQSIAFPATVDVELIFPRNDTYAPTVLMPIVFAIRNAQLAAPLDLNFGWTVYNMDDPHGPAIDGYLHLTNVDFSNTSDPYFAFRTTNEFNATEASWYLIWTLSSGNCSRSDASRGDDGVASSISFYNRVNPVSFTTRNGAQQPDLVPSDDTCASPDSYFTFNVTGILGTPDPAKYDGRDTCAVLAPTNMTASPTAALCGAGIDASAASSISAAITATACAFPNPVVSCPPDATSGAAAGNGMPFLGRRMAWLKTAAFAGLAFILMR